MGEDSGPSLYDRRDEDEDDDDDDDGESEGGNRLLGFMFGNVDNAGDLDVDYLDEEAKEHLAALAEKLGSSLTDIDLSIKSSHRHTDVFDQDYDEKAEDAVDYEDIDEQYEGPEIQATSEEDHLLPKKDYFSAEVSWSALQPKTSVFDEENYDEDEDFDEEPKVDVISEAQTIVSAGDNPRLVYEEKKPLGDLHLGELQEDKLDVPQEPSSERSTASLPVLYIEDGRTVLRFSEIFGIHEPIKKVEKRSRRYTTLKERFKVIDAHYAVEEDEEAFLRGPCQDSFGSVVMNSVCDRSTMKLQEEESHIFDVCQEVLKNPEEDVNSNKDSRLSAEPMKESITAKSVDGLGSPSCPTFCPLDQQDWEGDIVWGNSPLVSHGSSESCIISEVESEEHMREKVSEVGSENSSLEFQMEEDEKCHHLYLTSCPVVVESFGSLKISDHDNLYFSEKKHPQQLRLESCLKVDDRSHFEGGKENGTNHLHLGGAIRNFSKLPLQNLDLLEDAWLDNIIWDPDGEVSRPKLILDLQDTQMLFEIPDSKDVRHLQSHAGAMIVTRSSKQSCGDLFDQPGQMGASAGRFNISNDKYYSNRKSTQQLKSHSKKRTAHGVKVLHSTPAWKLQTMKPKLSNKDIANFHRPKALWYPHDNEMALKEQGKLSTQGPMKIILKSMGGKGSKLHVDAEETVHSVKAKASKKLDLKPSEEVKIVYSGKELEDNKSLAEENVRPNSILHLVRTKIHLWPKAQKIPGENKALRPPGAFKKKSELSLKDGHVFLMEYCEERPLLLGNVGMGARLCTYYQKYAPGDQTGSVLRNENSSLGNVLTLDPADKSPFLGDIRPGSSQSCIETNLYRAPIFPHKLCSTDYLLVRSAKGKLSLRRIDRVYVVGQQEPHMEVMSPGTKGLQTYIYNRLLVYIYREFGAMEKRGLLSRIRADELSAQFPNLSEPFVRKRLKQCADLQRQNGHLCWVMKRNFRIPLEEELRRMVTPENVCAYESMQAGHYRLKRQGISRLTHPTGLSYAMNQLPDEAIALAAASHIERELQITPWNLSSNFVACTNQDRENIERLEITGVGDPTGRGLGFSYVRVAPKAPLSSAVAKKKTAIAKGGPAVTGTDADLRRLSMEAAREVLLKFKVPEEQIAKQTRWHRIAMIRKLSSEQAASGVKVDSTTIGKYARGQRMSFLQLQQQTREKCQEIWDRQVQSLSAADEDENDSDSEANSDLDSFAGDLENLLDAEECGVDEEGNYDSKHNKEDGIKGLKMRRHPSQPQAEEEIEDEAAEAAELCRMLMDEDESNLRKKKKAGSVVREMGLDMHSNFGSAAMEQNLQNNTIVKKIIRVQQPDGSVIQREQIIDDPKEVELILAKRASKAKSKKGNNKSGAVRMALPKNKDKVNGDGFKFVKEKKQTDKPVRESFVCGACGQVGHMRTNKNCPRYGEDTDTQVDNVESGKVNFPDLLGRSHQKTSVKKLIPKGATRLALVETSENSDKAGSVTKVLPLKFKCGPGEKISETFTPSESQSSDKQFPVDIEAGPRSVNKISRIIISNKDKPEDVEPPKVVIKPPAVIDRDKPRKKIIIKQPKGNTIVDLTKEVSNTSMQESYRKTISISELSSLEKLRKQEDKRLAEEAAAERKAIEAARLWEEEERRRKMEIMRDQRRLYEEEQRIAEEQRLAAFRFESWKMDHEQQKSMKKKRKKEPEIVDKYMDVQRSSRDDHTFPGRNRSTKRRSMVELGKYSADIGPQTKRRRGAGEVGLANILETVVEGLKEASEVSYLFLKPVSKKEAPDYLDIIEHPMDLSTIKEKVRKLEYKSQEDFRHDVWQITLNAHQYNAGRNPGIPPLADQLLELCDYLLDQNRERLEEAEAGIDGGTTRA